MLTRVPARGSGPAQRPQAFAKAGSLTRSTARSQSSPAASTVATYGLAWSGRRTSTWRASAITWPFVTMRPPSIRKPLPDTPPTGSCCHGCDQS